MGVIDPNDITDLVLWKGLIFVFIRKAWGNLPYWRRDQLEYDRYFVIRGTLRQIKPLALSARVWNYDKENLPSRIQRLMDQFIAQEVANKLDEINGERERGNRALS